MRPASIVTPALVGVWLALAARSAAQQSSAPHPDVHYVPTRQPVVEAMLRLAGVSRHDVVYDLGSGDGRIVIAAAKRYGARGVGVELDTALVRRAAERARAEGVAQRVRFLQQDLFTTDISAATVVTLYLGPALNTRLRPVLLRDLHPGSRIVSHGWDLGDWEPDARLEAEGRKLFFWVVPARVAGEWRWRVPGVGGQSASLEQRYQKVTGRWVSGPDTVPIAAIRLVGDSIAFRAASRGVEFRFAGRVRGNAISGTIERDRSRPAPWKAHRAQPAESAGN